MGTNYYLHKGEQPCQCCGLSSDRDPLHIGKSSYGWCFALRIIPSDEIYDLGDWVKLFKSSPHTIFDEYGEIISLEDFLDVVLKRGDGDYCLPNSEVSRCSDTYPKHPKHPTLNRHQIDNRMCIGYPQDDSTYDICRGYFS